MKILMLTPYLPYPLYSGGQIRTYNLLKNLADRHQVTLVSFYRQDEELNYVDELKKYCVKVVPIKRRKTWGLTNILLSGFTPYPFLVCTYFSLKAQRKIKKELDSHPYDLIHVETFYLMPNLPPRLTTPILLVEQTIEYLVYQRYVENLQFWPLKPLLYLDVLKIKLWEKYYWRKATALAAVSAEDLEIMAKTCQHKNITVVANGVDVEFFEETPKKPSRRPTVLFVGNFKWLPNKDAAQFLVWHVWPLIRKKLPQARLWIVGRNPTPPIFSLAQVPGVTVKGNVPDIRQVFGRADVLLAPIRNGRGTKYKVLEAMAAQLPVVTTKLGIEGIAAQPGKQVLVAETAAGLAEKTVVLLKNPKLRRQIARSAKKLVAQKYNWQVISADLDRIYKKIGRL